MILVPKKVIESEIRLTNEEIDILVDYRIMMDRFINFMDRDDIPEVAGFHKEFFIHCKECAEQICTKALIETEAECRIYGGEKA